MGRVSVVVSTRNDDHGGAMAERFSSFVRLLRYQAVKHEIATELVVVEWNPPSDRSRLADDPAFWPATSTSQEKAFFGARVITVPRDLHRTLNHSERMPFFQMIAKNVGIRRAGNEWVLATNPDIVFDDRLFVGLRDILCDRQRAAKTIYRAERFDVRMPSFDSSEAPAVSLSRCAENVIRRHTANKRDVFPGLYTRACGDFMLVHKTDWNDLAGYDELELWSIHLDSLFLVRASAVGYNIRLLPGHVYHLEHALSWSTNRELAKQYPHMSLNELVTLSWVWENAPRRSPQTNDEAWGFGNDELEEVWAC